MQGGGGRGDHGFKGLERWEEQLVFVSILQHHEDEELREKR